jgi:hypothetical protein
MTLTTFPFFIEIRENSHRIMYLVLQSHKLILNELILVMRKCDINVSIFIRKSDLNG